MQIGMSNIVASILVFILSCVVLVAGAQAREVKLKGAVYSPYTGVLCDRKGGFCADSEGLSVALTKMYLGDAAEAKLMERIRPEPGVQDFDTTSFVLTNKVACDCKAKKCTVSKFDAKLDTTYTNTLFGK
jgi:hypothetical protein